MKVLECVLNPMLRTSKSKVFILHTVTCKIKSGSIISQNTCSEAKVVSLAKPSPPQRGMQWTVKVRVLFVDLSTRNVFSIWYILFRFELYFLIIDSIW